MKSAHSTLGLLAIASLIFCFTACYDDSSLQKEVNSLGSRVLTLENSVKQINRDIASLKMTISALENKIFVESLVATDNGYTLVFSNGTVAQLRNGAKGQDGQAPLISAALSNGTYYWTVTYDGKTNWILDEKGQKLAVRGKDGAPGQDGKPGEKGQDGLTPELKIDDEGYWRIRYGTQGDFQLLLDSRGEAISAIGPQGEQGESGENGDSFFQSLSEEDDCIRLVLADGSEIRLLKASPRLDIYFDADTEAEPVTCSSGEIVKIEYTLSYADSKTMIKLVATDGWKARVEAGDESHGQIIVTAPDPVCDTEILVLVSDGGEKTVLRSLCFVSGKLLIAKDLYTIDSQAATLEIPIHTNLQYQCEMDESASWISLQQSGLRSAMRNDTLRLKIQSNPGQGVRKAIVTLINTNRQTIQAISIWQANGSPTANEIHYMSTDADTLEVDFSAFHQKRISHTMYGNHGIIVFDNKVDYIGPRAFYYQKRLVSLRLPTQITAIGDYAFYGCNNLEAFNAPSKLQSLGNNAFGSCYKLPYIVFPEGFKSIGDGCFMDNRTLSSVDLPSTIESIGSYAFMYCRKLATVNCLAPEPPVLGTNAFNDNADKRLFYLPAESLEVYQDNLLWKVYLPYLVASDE